MNSAPQMPTQEPNNEQKMYDALNSAETTLREDLGFGQRGFDSQEINQKNSLDSIVGNLRDSTSSEDFIERLKTNAQCSQDRIDQILKNVDVANYLELQKQLS